MNISLCSDRNIDNRGIFDILLLVPYRFEVRGGQRHIMVAKKVGVSAMTVSKVINGKRDVKSERKEKVLRVIEKNI